MSQIISVSIDLSKLDKSKIIEGKKGKYYNLSIFVNDQKDQYGNDVSVCDSQTKEQRDAKEAKVYLGNGRVIYSGAPRQQEQQTSPAASNSSFDDLPF